MKVIAMNNVPVKLWVDQLDAHAWEEVNNLTTLPFLFHHLALMPDAHGGKGMPIGGVLATKGVVIPNAVGVDIGCGMCAVKTNLLVEEIPQDVLRKEIMRGIRKRIPILSSIFPTLNPGVPFLTTKQDNPLAFFSGSVSA